MTRCRQSLCHPGRSRNRDGSPLAARSSLGVVNPPGFVEPVFRREPGLVFAERLFHRREERRQFIFGHQDLFCAYQLAK